MKKPRGYWTLDKCKEDALFYAHRGEWSQKSKSAYSIAHRNNWIEECCQHMQLTRNPSGYWTLEQCKQDALKYDSKVNWKESSCAYSIAVKRGWIEECCQHMEVLWEKKWTKEMCLADALKYNTRTEWNKNSFGYYAAIKHDWFDECCSHMSNAGASSKPELELLSLVQKDNPNAHMLKMKDKNLFFKDKPHIKGFQIDIYIPELKKGIEFNGEYWHSFDGLQRSRKHWPIEDINNYHNLKQEFFKSKGISYINIDEKEWAQNKKNCIIKIEKFLGELSESAQ